MDDWVDVCGTSGLDEGGGWLGNRCGTNSMAMTGKSWENGKINRGNWGSSISRQIHIPIIPRWFWREQSEQIWTVQAMFDGGRTEPTVQLDRKPSICYQSTRWRQCKRAAALGIWTEMYSERGLRLILQPAFDFMPDSNGVRSQFLPSINLPFVHDLTMSLR